MIERKDFVKQPVTTQVGSDQALDQLVRALEAGDVDGTLRLIGFCPVTGNSSSEKPARRPS